MEVTHFSLFLLDPIQTTKIPGTFQDWCIRHSVPGHHHEGLDHRLGGRRGVLQSDGPHAGRVRGRRLQAHHSVRGCQPLHSIMWQCQVQISDRDQERVGDEEPHPDPQWPWRYQWGDGGQPPGREVSRSCWSNTNVILCLFSMHLFCFYLR